MSISKNIELKVDATSLGKLEEQLEGVNQELKEVEVGSDRFKELTKQSQLLNKEITKINDEIEGFQLEDKLMAADGAAKIFGGSLSAAVGTLGALGIESEAFGEFEEKAASAIAVGLGIKDVSEGFSQVALAAKKSGIAAKLFGTTTKRAIALTGVGVFALALGAIVANWDSINKGIKRFVNNTPFIGKAIDTVKGAFDSLLDAARPVLRFLGILPSEAEIAADKIKETVSLTIQELEREIAIAQAAGKSAEEIYKLRRKLMQLELQQMRDSNAEKEEIFKKETELLALEAAEQKRIRDEKGQYVEREKVQAVSAIQAKGMAEVETDKVTADTINIRQEEDLVKRERLIQSEIALQGKLDAAKQASLDNVIAIAGAESGVGKAAFIAKQVLAAREMLMEASKTIAFSSQAVARSTVAVAQGSAETAKVGFPQNIPLLIGYAVQAAGIISAVKQAVSSAKSAGTGSMSISPSFRGASVTAQPQAPAFNVVGAAPENQLAEALGEREERPVKAFVVSNEVTNAQALDRNIVETASLG